MLTVHSQTVDGCNRRSVADCSVGCNSHVCSVVSLQNGKQLKPPPPPPPGLVGRCICFAPYLRSCQLLVLPKARPLCAIPTVSDHGSGGRGWRFGHSEQQSVSSECVPVAQTRSVRSCPPTAAVDLLPGQAFEDSVRPQVLRRMQVLRTNNFWSERFGPNPSEPSPNPSEPSPNPSEPRTPMLTCVSGL